jgi:hypothetical protein
MQFTSNWFVEAKPMSFSKLEHAPNSFLSRRLSRGCAAGYFRKGGFVNQGKEVLLQRHAAGLSPGHETGFNVRL